ncbi:protein of unknown function (plasmid) [Rhodovastum atsumiense]|nr:protein of unknown function [Rhodovastum atsumiense]
MSVTLISAPRHAPNRQGITLQTGTRTRSKPAPDHAAIRRLLRRVMGTRSSGSLLAKRPYIDSALRSN